MDNNYDHLKQLLDTLKTIGFWSRLFSWSKIKNKLVDASAEIQKLLTNNENLVSRNLIIEQSLADVSKDLKLSNETVIRQQSEIDTLNLAEQENTAEISSLKSNISSANTTIANQQTRINELSVDNKLFNEKNDQFSRENKKPQMSQGCIVCSASVRL